MHRSSAHAISGRCCHRSSAGSGNTSGVPASAISVSRSRVHCMHRSSAHAISVSRIKRSRKCTAALADIHRLKPGLPDGVSGRYSHRSSAGSGNTSGVPASAGSGSRSSRVHCMHRSSAHAISGRCCHRSSAGSGNTSGVPASAGSGSRRVHCMHRSSAHAISVSRIKRSRQCTAALADIHRLKPGLPDGVSGRYSHRLSSGSGVPGSVPRSWMNAVFVPAGGDISRQMRDRLIHVGIGRCAVFAHFVVFVVQTPTA